MPELPEVETIRRSLRPIAGKRLTAIDFSPLAPIETTGPRQIRRALVDAAIAGLERRGKYLLIRSQRGPALVIHLGMSGQLLLHPQLPKPLEKHSHMVMRFADGAVLVFQDARRFGTLSLTEREDGSDNAFLQRLGPDYLDPQLTPELFIARCRRHPGLQLKALALHQGVASGLGNIYACEALYRSGLDPRRKVRRSKNAELEAFLAAARETLELGIRHGGSSLRDYFDGLGNRGVMKDFLQVYDREGQSTLDGRGRVKRIVQQARSTWYCPEVQR
ncbi:MAG: bifunctional DNA-formamidopyrimidine glycosylase/DNA-(apurinic or apyrimidinic site) lyase [bacterium]